MDLVMLTVMEEQRSEGVGNITLQGYECRCKALGAVEMHCGDKGNMAFVSEN